MAAVDDGGRKRTRFPCLATVRYMVTAVVAVLTIALTVKVITVDLRPEDIQLSILHGHIEASALWVKNETEMYPSDLRQTQSSTPCVDVNFGDATTVAAEGTNVDEDYSCESNRPSTIVRYEAARSMELRVTLSAYNPSGRVDVNCSNITLSILDMPNDSNNVTGAMMEIARIPLHGGFLVPKQSSHTQMLPPLPVSKKAVLDYIASTYGGKTSFRAMVMVNTTISSVTAVKLQTAPRPVSNVCPVVVGLDEPSMKDEAVLCMPGSQLVSDVSSAMLAPAPAPAPAVTGAAA